MARVPALLALLAVAEAAFLATPASNGSTVEAATNALIPTPVVRLSAEQQKAAHWGCVQACHPSPVESKCVTACEAAMYKCIDHTGPGETPEDTDQCQGKVLKLYKETKGIKKEAKIEEATEGKKEAKKEAKKGGEKEGKDKKKDAKKEKKKAKAFLQVFRNIDDENAEAAEMARLEAQSDKDMGEDDDEESGPNDAAKSGDDDEDESFVQVSRNIDDENAEAAEMARLEAQSDKDMGEDDDEESGPNDAAKAGDDDDEGESFVQVTRNIDDENAEAAEMARLEAQSDKDMGEDDDDESGPNDAVKTAEDDDDGDA